jgi:hypothetical protein
MRPSHIANESRLRRAIHLVIALALVALGGGGFVYLYFIRATWNGWMALAAGIVCAAGLYWLWGEYINAGPRPGN